MSTKIIHCLAFGGLALLSIGATAQRQTQAPHLAYVYPAGCERGASVEVKVGGQFLKGVTGAYVSGGGVQVVVGDYYKPFTRGEANQLRLKLDSARDKLVAQGVKLGGPAKALPILAKEAGISDEDLAKLREYRIEQADPKRQPNPQITETVALRISVDADAAPGIREMRLLSPQGLTNPIRFEVGTLPEAYEAQGADHSPQDLRNLPVEVNGRLLPGEVDRYGLNLAKGRHIVIAVGARRLIPYIADAVPGFFQATLTVFDAAGKEVAFSDRSESYQDPSIDFQVPSDGRYTLEIRDGLYRGREDFVYRLEIGDNAALPRDKRAAPLNSDDLGIGRVNTAAFDVLPQVGESEPNGDSKRAQRLDLPCAVRGRIDKAGDIDVYRFDGRRGQQVVMEVLARRLGSPMDSYLRLSDSAGHLVAWNDDCVDRAAGTLTDQADSYLRAKLPTDGVYFVTVSDSLRRGGKDFSYRLRVTAPEPGFALRIGPSSVTARAGMSVFLTVYALRRDGFDGDIALNLVDAPRGYALSGSVVPGNVDQLPVTLTVPDDPSEAPAVIRIEGVATVAGRQVKREARPVDEMMQAFANLHLVTESELAVAVIGKANRGLGVAPTAGTVKIPAGGRITYHLAIPRPGLLPRLRVSLADAPAGVAVGKVSADSTGLNIELRSDGKTAKAGLRGNVILEASMLPLAPKEPKIKKSGKAAPAPRPFSLGVLPAVPFEVVAG